MFDYVLIIVLFICFGLLDYVDPFQQHFALQNYTLQYPYAVKERVPVPLLYVCAIIAPAVIIALYALVLDALLQRRRARGRDDVLSFKERLWEANCGILGMLLASGSAFVITMVLKNATGKQDYTKSGIGSGIQFGLQYVGKPRPDFISRCQPDVKTFEDVYISSPLGLSNSSICTWTDKAIIKDAYRSFPSGHSSCRIVSILETAHR